MCVRSVTTGRWTDAFASGCRRAPARAAHRLRARHPVLETTRWTRYELLAGDRARRPSWRPRGARRGGLRGGPGAPVPERLTPAARHPAASVVVVDRPD